MQNYIHSLRKGESVYRTYKGNKLVAEAGSLEELVRSLSRDKSGLQDENMVSPLVEAPFLEISIGNPLSTRKMGRFSP